MRFLLLVTVLLTAGGCVHQPAVSHPALPNIDPDMLPDPDEPGLYEYYFAPNKLPDTLAT